MRPPRRKTNVGGPNLKGMKSRYEAKSAKKNTMKQVEKLKEEARVAGYEQGRRDGRIEGLKEMEGTKTQIKEYIENAKRKREETIRMAIDAAAHAITAMARMTDELR